jgi:hypothetical protein
MQKTKDTVKSKKHFRVVVEDIPLANGMTFRMLSKRFAN